jgi:hypothetical protein
MKRNSDTYTTGLAAALIVAALLACKKKEAPPTPTQEAPASAAVVAPPPSVAPLATAPSAPAPGPKLGDVKRYPDKEKTQSGAVKVLQADTKVFNEADDKTAEVALLDKDLFVFRLASIPDWELVEFPSGVGKVSPGWVQAKFLDAKVDNKVERDAVATQGKQAKVTGASSAKPATSVAAATSAGPTGSAKVAASASAPPATSVAASAPASSGAAARRALAEKLAAERKARLDKLKQETAPSGKP